MNNLRTVSDTKRAFYTIHTRPINSIYRRVVEELMVEMHLLRVNEDFRFDPIFALGMVTTFDRFMQDYRPVADKDSIFEALCRSQECDPQQQRQDAERMLAVAMGQSTAELLQWFTTAATAGGDELQTQIQAIASNPKFKYSRLFAIGLFTLLEQTDPQLVKDETRLNQALEQFGPVLNVSATKLQKDLELYSSNLEKMNQARKMMADLLEAERKRRQQATATQGTENSLTTGSQSTLEGTE